MFLNGGPITLDSRTGAARLHVSRSVHLPLQGRARPLEAPAGVRSALVHMLLTIKGQIAVYQQEATAAPRLPG